MMRMVALFLLLANLAYAAWSAGWLIPYFNGLPAPGPSREPERLSQQIEPNRIVLMTVYGEQPQPPAPTPPNPPAGSEVAEPGKPEAAIGSAADTTPPTPPATPPAPETDAPKRCIRIAALSEQQASVLRIALLATQPDGGWEMRTVTVPPRWIVYSGKLSTPAVMSAKKAELRLLGIEFREVQTPAFQPGLAMGTYSTEAAAQQVLREITRSGVRGAKVVQERAESTQTSVQWPAATEAQLAQTVALVQRLAAEGLEGKQVQPCP